ncbi:MAG: hypothetical protein KAH32_03740 [Chlamydiia bacterium]|nr:hypothetical protein [Chlamydiia bacterium]
MKKTLFILAALSCSFGGLGDLTRKAISKEYQSSRSNYSNLKDFIIGGPLSATMICISLSKIINYYISDNISKGKVFSYFGLLNAGIICASLTNCFGSTPANVSIYKE